MTENQMLDSLTAHVKSLKMRGVATPDYRETHFFTDQWKQFGAIRYYQLPKSRGGRIVALCYTVTGESRFSLEGFFEPIHGDARDL